MQIRAKIRRNSFKGLMKGHGGNTFHYLLSRRTRASEGILLHPVLCFPVMRNYQDKKKCLINALF